MNESVLPRGDHSPPCARAGTALHEFPGKPPAAALRRRPRDQRGAPVARRRDLRRLAQPHAADRPPPQGLCRAARRLRPLVAGPLSRAARCRQRPRHPVPRRRPRLGPRRAGLHHRGGNHAQDGARVRRPGGDHAAGRLRALGVRHARAVPGDRRAGRVGPGHRRLRPHHPPGRARPRVQAEQEAACHPHRQRVALRSPADAGGIGLGRDRSGDGCRPGPRPSSSAR